MIREILGSDKKISRFSGLIFNESYEDEQFYEDFAFLVI